MTQINNHGDIILKPVDEIKPPKNAKSGKKYILQQSEVTGNRHEVVSKKAPIFMWEKDGVKYLFCRENYIIQHVGGDEEHGKQEVGAGTRQILHELEHDPWKNELRKVID